MAIGKCSVVFDKASVALKISEAIDSSVFILGQQVLKDSNLYCPEDQETLKKSSEIASVHKKNVFYAAWDTEYARHQYYYGKNFTKKTAHKMWAHYAKAKHNKEWQALLQTELRKLV